VKILPSGGGDYRSVDPVLRGEGDLRSGY